MTSIRPRHLLIDPSLCARVGCDQGLRFALVDGARGRLEVHDSSAAFCSAVMNCEGIVESRTRLAAAVDYGEAAVFNERLVGIIALHMLPLMHEGRS